MSLPKRFGIYCLLCQPTGQRYVGASVNLGVRVASHIWTLSLGRHPNSRLQRAWSHYGIEQFTVVVLEEFSTLPTKSLLLQRERYWTTEYKALDPKYGFNLYLGTGKGRQLTSEQRQKLSDRLSARWAHPDAKQKAKETNKRIWADPARREAAAERARHRWADPEFRSKTNAAREQALKSKRTLKP